MNKIRIIDLLNKIANGEEVPKKIKYLGHIYNYDYEDVCYYDDDKQDLLEYALINCKYTAVNEEIEILDEPKENFTGWKMYQDGKVVCSIEGLKKEDKIEKIDVAWQNVFDEQAQQDFAKMTLNKINEIIDKLNKEE